MTLDELIKALQAIEESDPGGAVVFPVIGMTQPGDQVHQVELLDGAVFLRPGQKLSKSQKEQVS